MRIEYQADMNEFEGEYSGEYVYDDRDEEEF